jgi:hypothetical protein
MPNNNHLGPRGEGPMTGRKLGTCNSKEQQGDNKPLGLGNGKGRHQGQRQGRNRKFKNS